MTGRAETPKRLPTSQLARRWALVLHRYIGLLIALFVAVAGLTGSVLAFQQELDEFINPDLFFTEVPPASQPLDAFAVAERTRQCHEGGVGWDVPFHLEPGKTLQVWNSTDGETYVQRFVDPRTGEQIGEREWGNIGEGLRNLVPFIYRLHYSLALGTVGSVLLGVVALLWTVDCFIGIYLTTPAPGPRAATTGGAGTWLRRWSTAWFTRFNEWYAWVFTWHRASGLWVWGLLLMFAWSAVGFNLWPVYRPVMAATLGEHDSTHDALPTLAAPYAPSALSPERAYALARAYMHEQLELRGAQLLEEQSLSYAPEHAAIVYRVKSSLDIQDRYPRTEVYLSSATGEPLGFEAPTGLAAGSTVTSWLFALHMGTVGGLAYRLLLVLVGVAVAVLSFTGVAIWWRKAGRRARRLKRSVSPTSNTDRAISPATVEITRS